MSEFPQFQMTGSAHPEPVEGCLGFFRRAIKLLALATLASGALVVASCGGEANEPTAGWVKYEGNPVLGGQLGTSSISPC